MADENYYSSLSGPELDAALRAATTVKATVRSELQIAKDSGEFDGPQGIQGLQGPMGTLGQAGQIQDFESAAAVAGPSFNYYSSFSTPLIEGVNGSKICGVTTLPAGYWTYQIFLLGNADSPTMLMRRIDRESGDVAEELEWVNPPMEPDVVYRTTKRHNGKAVYTMAHNITRLGTAGESSAMVYPDVLVDEIVNTQISFLNSTTLRTFPYPLISDDGAVLTRFNVSHNSAGTQIYFNLKEFADHSIADMAYCVIEFTRQ